jgi:hypothetical protein
MRSILLIALSTALACEATEADISDSHDAQDSEAETTRQAPGDIENLLESDDLAGGMPKHADELVYFDNFDRYEEEQSNGWESAPMREGRYLAIIEEVQEKECSPLKPGDEFGAMLLVDEDGNSVLNGGILESDGDEIRYSRVKDAPYQDTEDCFALEITKGSGLLQDHTEMGIDFEITMSLVGTDCPVMDPCTDAYSAWFEHQGPVVDQPFDPGDDWNLEIDIAD